MFFFAKQNIYFLYLSKLIFIKYLFFILKLIYNNLLLFILYLENEIGENGCNYIS